MTFKAPQYTKVVNSKTGVLEPCYTFLIENTDELSFIANDADELSLKSLQKCLLDNVPWWNSFITAFLENSSKLFSKTYTIETINKITKHTLNGNTTDKYPVNVLFVPKNIQICGGVFTVNWGYDIEQVLIPDFETPDSISVINELNIDELNIDELPIEESTEVLEIEAPTKFYDKQRVKELRLKAKLAHYKADRELTEYYDKYGDDISDSETSDD